MKVKILGQRLDITKEDVETVVDSLSPHVGGRKYWVVVKEEPYSLKTVYLALAGESSAGDRVLDVQGVARFFERLGFAVISEGERLTRFSAEEASNPAELLTKLRGEGKSKPKEAKVAVTETPSAAGTKLVISRQGYLYQLGRYELVGAAAKIDPEEGVGPVWVEVDGDLYDARGLIKAAVGGEFDTYLSPTRLAAALRALDFDVTVEGQDTEDLTDPETFVEGLDEVKQAVGVDDREAGIAESDEELGLGLEEEY